VFDRGSPDHPRGAEDQDSISHSVGPAAPGSAGRAPP
jgi:hypothetical protein